MEREIPDLPAPERDQAASDADSASRQAQDEGALPDAKRDGKPLVKGREEGEREAPESPVAADGTDFETTPARRDGYAAVDAGEEAGGAAHAGDEAEAGEEPREVETVAARPSGAAAPERVLQPGSDGTAEAPDAGGETTEAGADDAAEADTESPAPAPFSLRQWIRDHDEKWLFVGIYLGLAVVLSVLVSLFWLLVVALLHFGLECIRQTHYRNGARDTVFHALWEIKLDVALVLLALTLVLYIDVVLGLLGLQSAARAAAVTRAGARLGSRAAAWERNLRTFLLTVDEMFRVGHAAVMLKKKRGKGKVTTSEAVREVVEEEERSREAEARRATQPAWRARWKLGDKISMALVISGVVLILAAPFFTPHDWASAAAALMHELRPFPS